MMGLENIQKDLVDIAESAGQLALSFFRKTILIETKSNGTPVTIADKKTEEFIREKLKAKYPSFGVLGEEYGEDLKGSEYTFTIDPIDGTRSFVRGIPLFGTLIALLRNQTPIVGVMVLPALEETYYAAQGLGAFCNGQVIRASASVALEGSFISVGDVACFENAGLSPLLSRLQKQGDTVRGYTDCFGHALVMRGSVDAMIDPVVSIWDVAPLACLVEEAGGVYGNLSGEKTIFSSTFFTAATPILAQAIVNG